MAIKQSTLMKELVAAMLAGNNTRGADIVNEMNACKIYPITLVSKLDKSDIATLRDMGWFKAYRAGIDDGGAIDGYLAGTDQSAGKWYIDAFNAALYCSAYMVLERLFAGHNPQANIDSNSKTNLVDYMYLAPERKNTFSKLMELHLIADANIGVSEALSVPGITGEYPFFKLFEIARDNGLNTHMSQMLLSTAYNIAAHVDMTDKAGDTIIHKLFAEARDSKHGEAAKDLALQMMDSCLQYELQSKFDWLSLYSTGSDVINHEPESWTLLHSATYARCNEAINQLIDIFPLNMVVMPDKRGNYFWELLDPSNDKDMATMGCIDKKLTEWLARPGNILPKEAAANYKEHESMFRPLNLSAPDDVVGEDTLLFQMDNNIEY